MTRNAARYRGPAWIAALLTCALLAAPTQGWGEGALVTWRSRGVSRCVHCRRDCQFREFVDQRLDLVLRVVGRLINEPGPRRRDYREHENSHERHRLDKLLRGKVTNPIEVEDVFGGHKTSMMPAADSFSTTRRPFNSPRPLEPR